MSPDSSRRSFLSLLGMAGAAALAPIKLPFTPKPTDIVVARRVPETINIPRLGAPHPMENMLLRRDGTPFAIIRSWTLNIRPHFEVFESATGWRETMMREIPGMNLSLDAEIISDPSKMTHESYIVEGIGDEKGIIRF